jgi:hypothetical protein
MNRPGNTVLLMLAALALAACSPDKPRHAEAESKKPAAAAQPAPIGHSPLPAHDVGRSDLFHGYRCGGDCSLHQQGYKWAADHRIINPRDCRGGSESFIEGCRAYAGIDGPLGVREIFQDED